MSILVIATILSHNSIVLSSTHTASSNHNNRCRRLRLLSLQVVAIHTYIIKDLTLFSPRLHLHLHIANQLRTGSLMFKVARSRRITPLHPLSSNTNCCSNSNSISTTNGNRRNLQLH